MRQHFKLLAAVISGAAASIGAQAQDGFSFRSGVELINVTATVTDDNGRFVAGLRKEDFTVYEDGEVQEITHFSSDRVPVSLGIALDASGSMTEDKMRAARAAIDRFIFDLLGPDDELFFLEFSTSAILTQRWTDDRSRISRAVRNVDPSGGTALYDAIAAAIPEADSGRNLKKALLVISDGNDTDSQIGVRELRQIIRESDVLVYALGVDGDARSRAVRPPTIRLPIPIPFPGGGRPRFPPPVTGGSPWPRTGSGERVNADALRQITDDTGGRTEIIRDFGDLDAATARIADELSKQYYLGYPRTSEADGRWHSIRVEVRGGRYHVRARRGYVAG